MIPLDLVAEVRRPWRKGGLFASEASDALNADPGEDIVLQGKFPRSVAEEPSAGIGILALRVLPHDQDVDGRSLWDSDIRCYPRE
jgi:hypothetical protein